MISFATAIRKIHQQNQALTGGTAVAFAVNRKSQSHCREETIREAMKRNTHGLLAVALGLALASSARAFTGSYTAGTGINGTVHDLSTAHNGMNYSANPADPLRRICIFCHAPHNTYKLSTANGGPGSGVGGGAHAPDAFDYLPMWNHELTGNSASYTMYQSGSGAPTANANASQAIAIGMTPGGSSLLCLSCHDGSVAVNSYGNSSPSSSQSSGGTRISTAYMIGNDSSLGEHHPIGFDYDAVQAANSGIRSADIATLGSAGTVRDHLFGADNTKMECGTCHSVHNSGNTGESLLWRSDANSEFCLTCHNT